MPVSWIYYLLFRDKNLRVIIEGCISPTTFTDNTMCWIGIKLTQNTTQTLIGGELKTMPTFPNVLVSWRGCVNKPMERLPLGRFVVRRFVANFVLVRMGLYICYNSMCIFCLSFVVCRFQFAVCRLPFAVFGLLLFLL